MAIEPQKKGKFIWEAHELETIEQSDDLEFIPSFKTQYI